MRAWQPVPGESSKAFAAFEVYRDLGSERSIDRAYEVYSGRQLGGKRAPGRFQKWSRAHDWVERARAHDDYLTMIRLSAIEEHESTRAVEFARRQEALREKNLQIGEMAAEQASRMLDWPLEVRTTIKPDPETGEMVTYIIMPAKWTKNTIARLHAVAAKAAGEPDRVILEEAAEEDLSRWSREDLETLAALYDKYEDDAGNLPEK